MVFLNDDRSATGRPVIGLALGGGVARGWSHIGVVKALADIGIEPDIICGTSVGSLVGGCQRTGTLDYLEDWARGLNKVKMLSYLDLSFSGGLIGGDRLVDEMLEHIGTVEIETLKPYAAIATDLTTGHEVWIRNGPIHQAMRASFGLPGIFDPVKLNGRWLVDGALTNPIPVTACRAMGAQIVIAVSLMGDWAGQIEMFDDGVPRVTGMDLADEITVDKASSWFNPASWMVKKLFERRSATPSLFGTMSGSLGIILDRISRSRLGGDPPDILLTPRIGHMGLFEFDRADEAIRLGREAVARSESEIKGALAALQKKTV